MNAGNAGVGEPNTAVIDSLLGGSELEVSCEPCLILMPFAPQLRQLLLTWLAEQVQLQPSRAPRRLPLLLPAARRLAARLLRVLAKVLGLLQLHRCHLLRLLLREQQLQPGPRWRRDGQTYGICKW